MHKCMCACAPHIERPGLRDLCICFACMRVRVGNVTHHPPLLGRRCSVHSQRLCSEGLESRSFEENGEEWRAVLRRREWRGVGRAFEKRTREERRAGEREETEERRGQRKSNRTTRVEVPDGIRISHSPPPRDT